jgi:seryl-tRNA synthetase
MGHITVLCDDLQPRNGIAVSDDIVKRMRTILLDPFTNEFLLPACNMMRTYQGSSYGRSDPFALDAAAMRDSDASHVTNRDETRFMASLLSRCRCTALSHLRVRTRHYSSKSPNNSTTATLPKPRLDYRAISENAVYKSHNAFNRKAPLPIGAIQSIERLYNRHKELLHALNAKRHARSLIGDRIRQAGNDEEARSAALQHAKELKSVVSKLEHDLAQVDDELFSLASAVPNDTHPLTPLGPEPAAVILSTHGPDPLPHSPLRDHVSICRDLDLLDLEAGATVTGSSWYYLLHEAAMLEMALTNYGLSVALKHGYTPVTTPDVVRSDVAQRCGFQPRDNADPPVSQMYHLSANDPSSSSSSSSHPDLVLSGTAEIPLAGMFANKILALKDLPLKVVGLGRAFRAEAGARGTDARGLYRVHQFTKLELFAISQAGQGKSEEMMEEMRRVQVEIFSGLGFPFRCVENFPIPHPEVDMDMDMVLWSSRSRKSR